MPLGESIISSMSVVDERHRHASAVLSRDGSRSWRAHAVAGLEDLEQVRDLIARGMRLGTLTYAETAAVAADLEPDDAGAEELRGPLDQGAIDLVDALDAELVSMDRDGGDGAGSDAYAGCASEMWRV
jgi:hypothetical protein